MLSASDIASMTAIVNASFEQTVVVQRKSVTSDGAGHDVESWTTVLTTKVNISKPTSTQLALYGSIIGSQWALMVRYDPTTGIREGDRFYYMSRYWLAQNIQNAESYTYANDLLITVIV